MTRFLTPLLGSVVALVLLAGACASDDDVLGDAIETDTTVPQVTEAPDAAADDPEPDDPDDSAATDEPDDPDESAANDDPDATDAEDDEPAPADDPPTSDADAAAAEAFRTVDVTIELVAEMDQPIDAVVAPNGEWWIAERHGGVFVVDPDTGAVGERIFDITDETRASGERGLLGLAVDDEALYVNYTDGDRNTQVEAVLLGADGRPGERVTLLSIEQPFGNHNGGALAIGPDGHLYIAVGDGGDRNDPLLAGQDPDTLLAKILRIDPTPGGASPYAIPADNPYADGGGAPEVFLIGVRNPWRISFDAATGDLWVADVGQSRWEEVTLLLGANGSGIGANLGWNLREGVEEFRGERPDGNVDPVFVYGHRGDISGCSITGGEVYRGSSIPDLVGAYVFGDYCTSDLWAISVASGEVVFVDLGIAMPGGDLADFSLDPNGEIVALSLGGAVVRIVAS